ncbi:tetratricopeptide repeat protein [Ramlibacter sp.]|uniref:O-linked N-acetylglucosamine transferase, SPINDLY family protein n=1 Tax=Ramlibacter sp. TaxID=1917967 RepID=UPI003D0EF4CD
MTDSVHRDYVAALTLWREGRKLEARDALKRVVDAAPQEVVYWANLAAAHVELAEWAAAESAIRRALALDAGRAESWHGLGNALTGQQRWLEAAQAYERALELKPDLPNGDATAAAAWQRAQQPEAAARRYLRSISGVHGRDDPEVLTATAHVLRELGQIDQPLELYRRVAALLPANAAAHNNLGMIHQAAGNYDEAIGCYRKALELAPALHSCWSNLIVCLNYSPSYGPRDVRHAAEEFDRNCARALMPAVGHDNNPDENRRLRVGYVSPDLHRHAVAYFLLPLLEAHGDAVEVVCYNSSTLEDEWTARLRAASSQWVDCAAMSDEVLAQRIREDRIDILVDLAGHTENNRLLTFARRPAPVQVNWLGYVLTTGVGAIGWRMTYAETDPPDADADYTERSWRLDTGMWGWRPLLGMPEVAPPPFQRKGVVTFGHLNRYSKVSRPALECWARILQQVPGSRLAIGLPAGATRGATARFFEARGVAANRIDAYDKMQHERFWAMHGEIDIALDPFPFNGGTTSYETLWMGVPLVTCTGEGGGFAPRFSSRMGRALLRAVGVPELVAHDPDAYVDTAVALARDPARLASTRAQLRERMRLSPLLDEARNAREVEAAYRGMWRQWCEVARG